MKPHKVQQGEDMVTISVKHGIADWETIYNHTANQRLKELRPDPMCLAPGDIVYIPDKEPIKFLCATNQSHTIKIPMPKVYFSTQFLDEEGEPLSGIEYELEIDDLSFSGSTDGDGKIEHKVPVGSKKGTLKIWPDPDNTDYMEELVVDIGGLDPVDEISGIQQRLNNSGNYAANIDNEFGMLTQAAIIEFAEKNNIETKKIDGELLNKLDNKK